VKTWA